MRIGVPKEIKNNERRVGMTPDGVAAVVAAGHEVIIEAGAGVGSGFTDADYQAAGATLGSQAEAWAQELVVKVKEPIAAEYGFLREDLTLFCYLHLAAEPELTKALLDAGTKAIAFETVVGPQGGLPLLAPMSEIAGRLGAQIGANLLLSANGGPGVLPGGIAGVAPINVTVVGGGTAGAQAVDVAVGLGAQVTVLDVNTTTLRAFMNRYEGRVRCIASTPSAVKEELSRSHLVIGSVLIPGAKAPKVVSAEAIEGMPSGGVVVDIAIDQGGCTELSKPTSHTEPTFSVGDKTMYCVTNMPGTASYTATRALAAETLRYVLAMANKGVDAALAADPGFALGLNTDKGEIKCEALLD
ncbi:MAG: alanine dehydrogenase [Corynebacterium sp.]|nr:alanine dehydrogenase [Corynebacterium sp.]